MSVQNTSKEEQQQYKKKKEWNAIKNCIPLINGKHSIFRLDAHYSQTYLCAITK